MAGRAAEEVVFDEISTGAGNDLERATDIARRMVAELGMSDKLGPVALMRRATAFLQVGEPSANGKPEYSEDTARTMDMEIRRLLVDAYTRARQILQADRDILEVLARRLLEKEVVDRDELRHLIGKPAELPGDGRRPQLGHVSTPAAD
jgi:cell division protease FtsH